MTLPAIDPKLTPAQHTCWQQILAVYQTKQSDGMFNYRLGTLSPRPRSGIRQSTLRCLHEAGLIQLRRYPGGILFKVVE